MRTIEDLKKLQELPLEIKIEHTKLKIQEFIHEINAPPTVSFSGGKDSTVLLHIVRSLYPDTKAFFADTGLEYPEIRTFVKEFDNVEFVRPKMMFPEVVRRYGYPIIGKEVSGVVYYARKGSDWALQRLEGKRDGREDEYAKRYKKYKPLLVAPFSISKYCCNILKKNPLKRVKSPTFIGTLASESTLRQTGWIRNGCNIFLASGEQKSTPLSFWTEQDILLYIKENNLPIAPIYGEISECPNSNLCLTGVSRTGCAFCGYGAHHDKGLSRFERLKETHPKIYTYSIGGGEFDPVDGLWKPNSKGLGMGFVFDWCNENISNFTIKY